MVIGLMRCCVGSTSHISSYCISWFSGKVVMTMRRRLFGLHDGYAGGLL
ncbi:hypothetical protein LNP74_25565 [Klebsiella pneumoniae subsp. pneumoniae]|nr:hypothetical protein [Klebsiella pneumoniae subsp. pneumoniae]